MLDDNGNFIEGSFEGRTHRTNFANKDYVLAQRRADNHGPYIKLTGLTHRKALRRRRAAPSRSVRRGGAPRGLQELRRGGRIGRYIESRLKMLHTHEKPARTANAAWGEAATSSPWKTAN